MTERISTLLPGEVLVFVDLSCGEIDETARGVLSEASRLAGRLGCGWSAISFAGAGSETIEEMAPYGVQKVTLIESAPGVADSLEAQGRLLAQASSELGATLVLLPHNDLGGTLAPLVTSQLKAALFTEAISYEEHEAGLKMSRRVLGEQVAETKVWDGTSPLVLTMSPLVLSAVVLPAMRRGEAQVAWWRPSAPVAAGASRILERIPPDPQTVDVSEAEVMVSVGLGCDKETFEQVRELTRLLNASLGVTRPVYDLGFAGFERMVGQTGKTVAPRFYLALGISGSMHHLGGIKDSKRIVAVNLDPKAPIFPNSDEAFVADLRHVLPLLVERVKSAVGGAA
ncbi:electron transfer flavoprotein subunit alpha/FixB family protein [Desulfuromonas sp. TF]|uniref:electron transfer flavoprotein subunit alpha/FixB family protein n=1 Tax=Desulfuromonas sp. TF TaxID=1232410 RepID=UPI0003FAE214|nr:electron transfer flavoprotein subunit alpha/FixB family protein [Desulfuromonas sp. TF]